MLEGNADVPSVRDPSTHSILLSIAVLFISITWMTIISCRYYIVPIVENHMIGISPDFFLQAGMLNWSKQHGLSLVPISSLPNL